MVEAVFKKVRWPELKSNKTPCLNKKKPFFFEYLQGGNIKLKFRHKFVTYIAYIDIYKYTFVITIHRDSARSLNDSDIHSNDIRIVIVDKNKRKDNSI